jgi:hypothetical protein
MKDGSGKRGARFAFRQSLIDMLESAHAARGNHRNSNPFRNRFGQF